MVDVAKLDVSNAKLLVLDGSAQIVILLTNCVFLPVVPERSFELCRIILFQKNCSIERAEEILEL